MILPEEVMGSIRSDAFLGPVTAQAMARFGSK
jgi:hypothetical protein